MTSAAQAQIGHLQRAAQDVMTDTAVIERNTGTKNTRGGMSDVWGAVATTVCRVIPFAGRKGGAEDMVQGRFEVGLFYKIPLPAGTDVTEKDRITVGSRTFEVKSVLRPADWEVQREAFCVERLSG